MACLCVSLFQRTSCRISKAGSAIVTALFLVFLLIDMRTIQRQAIYTCVEELLCSHPFDSFGTRRVAIVWRLGAASFFDGGLKLTPESPPPL
jgi:hypothetical protein